MSQRIEDYALIGNMRTAALVGRDGSIDWLCLPLQLIDVLRRALRYARQRPLVNRAARRALYQPPLSWRNHDPRKPF